MSDASKVVPNWANAIRLTGTGSQRTAELRQGEWYTVHVGSAAARITVGNSSVTADNTDPILGAYTAHSFNLEGGGYIAMAHEDGATSFEAHVVPSSPGAGLA